MNRNAIILRELGAIPTRGRVVVGMAGDCGCMSGDCGCGADSMGWNPTEETFNEFANRSDEVVLNPPYPETGGQIIDMGDAGLIWMAERRVKKCGLGSYPKNGRTGRRCREALRTWARRQGGNDRARKQTQELAYGTAGAERSESRRGRTIGGFIDPSSNPQLQKDPAAPLPVMKLIAPIKDLKVPQKSMVISQAAVQALAPTMTWDYNAPDPEDTELGPNSRGYVRIFGLRPMTLALYGAGVVGVIGLLYYLTLGRR